MVQSYQSRMEQRKMIKILWELVPPIYKRKIGYLLLLFLFILVLAYLIGYLSGYNDNICLCKSTFL